MKKYPIIYKGKEYEVRWEQASLVCNTLYDSITIYEVQKIKILGIKIKRYIEKFSEYQHNIDNHIYPLSNQNYYIEEVKTLFNIWELQTQEKRKKQEESVAKLRTLEEWDGVIDE